MPRLIFTQPEFQQQFLELPDGVFSVGRSQRNQIIIDDPSVSKEHAELSVHGRELIVRERGSHNGTFVGGARIEAQSGVKHGQRVRFGPVELLLELPPPPLEESTNITATASLARMLHQAVNSSQTPTRFPCRFTPQEAAAPGGLTVASPYPHPAPPPVPAPSQNPPPAQANPPSTVWTCAILGVGALFLAIFWLLR